MMNDRHPSPDYPREEKQPGDPGGHVKGGIRPESAQSGNGPPPSSMGPPPSYTTVTMTTDNTPGARVTEINLNIGYYKSLPGIIKIVQLVRFLIPIIYLLFKEVIKLQYIILWCLTLSISFQVFGIICMACASPAARYYEPINGRASSLNFGVGHNHWFLFVIVTSFIITFLWSCFYFLQLKDSINMKLPFSWLKLVSLLEFDFNC